MKLQTKLLTATALAALLSACGGGGGGYESSPAGGNGVPASATATPSAYTTFAASLQKSETATPLDLTGVIAPKSETAPPQAL